MNPVRPLAISAEASARYYGWRVMGACFVLALLSWGFGFYGHGFYLAELRRLHGWPASLIAGASTASYVFSALLVVFVNDALQRFGISACVLFGAAALAGSAAALPFLVEPWQLVATYLVMSFGWATMSLGAINNILGLWFQERRGLAISLALNGASFSGVLVVPSLVLIAAATSFATAMLTGAAVILALAVPLAATVLRRPPPPSAPPAGGIAVPSPSAPPAAWTRAKALRSFAFWSVCAPFAIAITSQCGFLVHQIAFLEQSIGRAGAGAAVAITTAMAIIGRLALGAMANWLDQRIASAVSLSSQAAALAVMMHTGDEATLLAACAVYGFSVGNLITFPALIVQREFDAAAFGLIISLSTGISQFTYAFGPGLLGLVRDASGGYPAALAVCIALNLAAVALVLKRPPASAIPA
jgi:predicted MFS family arabinose efflux permease